MNIKHLQKISDYLWEIPATHRKAMRVPARIFASDSLIDQIKQDQTLDQLVNVATLPGIVNHALAMPDAHEGYGFPVGGVAAFDPQQDGIISPGGIGYDINCGVRLLRSSLTFKDLQPHLEKLTPSLYQHIPSGVGRGGKLKLNRPDLDRILINGAPELIGLNYALPEDIQHLESQGHLDNADPDLVSNHAKTRGRDQLGTMGAGNHFVEIDTIDTVFDQPAAHSLQLTQGQICVLIHTGSRGLGHQVATDYIRTMIKTLTQYKINLPDRELACAPFNSPHGQNYFQAMACAANFAWANRQLITWEVRQAWQHILGHSGGQLEVVYDVAHNIAKLESYSLIANSKKLTANLVVHRKGATRAFPNQPVIIPGSMGTASYLLLGQPASLQVSFGSTCHGAGRRMSRRQATKQFDSAQLMTQLRQQGITIQTGSLKGLTEEAPQAYKDVDQVVEVIHQLGIATKVARLKPLAVIKG